MFTTQTSGSKWRAVFASLFAFLIFGAALAATTYDVREPSHQGKAAYNLASALKAPTDALCLSDGGRQQDHQQGHTCHRLCGLCQITTVNDRAGIISISRDDLIETLVPVSDPARRVELIEDNRVLYREGWINSWSATAPPAGRSFI